MKEKSHLCDICGELEGGFMKGICNVCSAKMAAIIECDTPEKAELLLLSFKRYPTSKSALLKD